MKPVVILEVAEGPQRGERWVYERKDTFLFGRADGCHARLSQEDRKVSRRHFLLEINPPYASLRDLGSRNRTFVNGVPFGGRCRDETPEEGVQRSYPQVDLRDGDRIRVGRSELRVQIPDHGMVESASSESLSPQQLIDRIVEQTPETAPLSLPSLRVEKRLGVGGQGAVYLARDAQGNRVAIKTLLAKIAVDPLARGRFDREIDLLRTLTHPNIVSILDHGAVGDCFYFVMEYCDGGSLDDQLEGLRRPMKWAEARNHFLQVAEGMAFAHKQGFVHRDIKPANILLAGNGEAKISDFGLAKNFEENGFDGLTLTKHGPAGTLPFMPHEQLEAFRHVKPHTDVWALGAMMYYTLTLQYPREYRPLADPFQQVLEDRCVPILRRRRDIPTAVAKVIDQALEYETSDRYPDARALYNALQSAAG